MKSSGKSFQTILVAFIALALVSGIFVASNATTTAMDNVVVCVNKKTGTMRLPMKDKCKKKEQKIVLARTGPQGIQGVQGAIGPAGPAGPVGSGGNYLNSKFGIYDAAGKLTPFEILSYSYNYGTTLALGQYVLPSARKLNQLYKGAGQSFLYKDSECQNKVATPTASKNNLFPSVQVQSNLIELFTSEAKFRMPLKHWEFTKYGRYFLKYRENNFPLESAQRYMIALQAAYYKKRKVKQEIQNHLEKVRYTDFEIVGDKRGGTCISIEDFLNKVSRNGEAPFALLMWHLFSDGEKHIVPGGLFNLNLLSESTDTLQLSDVLNLSEFSAYVQTRYPVFWDVYQSYGRRFDNDMFSRISFLREVNFPFEFPLKFKRKP